MKETFCFVMLVLLKDAKPISPSSFSSLSSITILDKTPVALVGGAT